MDTSMHMEPQENILEYETDTKRRTIICHRQEVYLGIEKDKWIFPGRTYVLPTHVKILSIPPNTVGLITRCPWVKSNIDVVPQIIRYGGYIFIEVRNIGFLPTRISAEQILANLTILNRPDCHIVKG